MNRPEKNEYAEYYHKYVNGVPEGDIRDVLEDQLNSTITFLSSIDEEKSKLRYAPGKWSLREVLGHIIDSERVFAYRALRFSRGDEKSLQGFDENLYIDNSNYDTTNLSRLIEEFSLIRQSTVALFRNLRDEQWLKKGNASGYNVTVRGLAYIIAGHTEHHLNVIKERYL
ncbi:MAG TPA: DinB family protein [Melioribacteraceae bacterium]|nr:DinB family protein [Melioribacteraceae bacterium]